MKSKTFKNINMKLSYKICLLLVTVVLSLYSCAVKIPNAKTENVKIYGNCEMCKKTIEEAAFKKKEAKADWNMESNLATITFDSTKTNMETILKRVALFGYDSDKFLAPDEAYNKLNKCCKYTRISKPLANNPDSINQENLIILDTVVIEQETNQLNAVFDNYFEIKDALIKTDGILASAKAKDLLVAITKVKMGALENKQHIVWMKIMDDLALDTKHISETTDPKQQRQSYAKLSKNMYELMKVSKMEVPVYYQFCPMYNEGKGAYWLSKESTIKNPYYGSQMLSCGRTVETIK